MKTLTLTNFEIDAIVKTLESPDSILYSDDPKKTLPISLLWKMDENFEKLKVIQQRILKQREQLEKRYADDEHSFIDNVNGNQVRKIKDAYMTEFSKELGELLSIKNDVEIDPIMIESLSDKVLTPKDYRSIRFMLDKNTVEEKDEVKSDG